MGNDDESRLGLYAGVLAAVMVVALSVMALIALEPPKMVADNAPSILQRHQAEMLVGEPRT